MDATAYAARPGRPENPTTRRRIRLDEQLADPNIRLYPDEEFRRVSEQRFPEWKVSCFRDSLYGASASCERLF